MDNEKEEFYRSLRHLPVIRKNIIKYATTIIQNSTNSKQEQELTNKAVEDILNEMKSFGIVLSDDDIQLLKYGLEILIRNQIPASKLAAKIRSLKDKPPSLFT